MGSELSQAKDSRVNYGLLAPGDRRHGTHNGYKNLGCRCEPCRLANNAACNEYAHRVGIFKLHRDEYLEQQSAKAWAKPCGTETKYKLGCRCDACKSFATAERRRRRPTATPQVHGVNAYKNGCRCDECRVAYVAHDRAYRRARKAQ